MSGWQEVWVTLKDATIFWHAGRPARPGSASSRRGGPPPPEEDYSQIRESGWEERAWEAEKPASVEDVLRDAGAEALARLDEKRDALAEAERRWGGGPKASSSLADMD